MKRNQIVELLIFASLLFGKEVNHYKEIKYLNVALRGDMEVYTMTGEVSWQKAQKRKKRKDQALIEREAKGFSKRTSEMGKTRIIQL